jgi:hypothetical protein
MSHRAKFVLSLELEKLIFTPIKHAYNMELERITTWVRMGKNEKQWASIVKLVGLFELQWKAPCHD